MICFLTSSPCVEGELTLNPANGFVEELHDTLAQPCRCVYVCSDPNCAEETDRFAGEIAACFEKEGFVFSMYEVLDGRNADQAAELIGQADFLILAGGHVPTQNEFFQEIGLRDLLRGFDGVLMGISAGTMNSAEVVYAHPELPGEAVSPEYQRFLPGLGLTRVMILPHYQMVQGGVLDGLRLFEDIAYPDSVGRRFYALVDGSFLTIRDGEQELRGEAYLIEDGAMRQIGAEGDILPL